MQTTILIVKVMTQEEYCYLHLLPQCSQPFVPFYHLDYCKSFWTIDYIQTDAPMRQRVDLYLLS